MNYNMKEVVQIAATFLQEMFTGVAADIRLEEVEIADEGPWWNVILSYAPRTLSNLIGERPERVYKLVQINCDDRRTSGFEGLETLSTYAELLLQTYKEKGVLIDTNLLLLLFIGSYDKGLIASGSFKRTIQYNVQDYEVLVKLLNWFRKAVTTPHILTEVSNLAGQLAEDQKIRCFSTLNKRLRTL